MKYGVIITGHSGPQAEELAEQYPYGHRCVLRDKEYQGEPDCLEGTKAQCEKAVESLRKSFGDTTSYEIISLQ